ncbi:NUDIX domain-containing protein [Teredinibacter sp. KSP-S5-2]|uniref:NUDIX domain-containing protein n=1 Tax=Teredinibacter sp. KSP-S5-2 TaxID=3034506 RepID=UPI00293496CB|nr:NUDIX domain-containing protein [Teredinibacter sp. KSP-S5-2]WNO09397.1 NUDIX domain-containing protein [Teredinibacter sp. KSP-S5-2]
MQRLKPKFDRSDVEVVSDELAYDGFFKMYLLKVKHRLFSGGWSTMLSRELFHRGQAVAVVLYDPVLDLVGLVDQFRIGAIESEHGPWCLEVVAGMIEKGEEPEAVAHREIEEEAGLTDVSLRHITTYYSTPGGCSEKIHLYCALCDLSDGGGEHGLDEEHEDIYLHTIPAAEVFSGMLNSRANNAATLIGLQWLQLNRESLRSSGS